MYFFFKVKWYLLMIPYLTFSFILFHAMDKQKTAAMGGERYAAMDWM